MLMSNINRQMYNVGSYVHEMYAKGQFRLLVSKDSILSFTVNLLYKFTGIQLSTKL